jgi:hypothetical protein
VLPELLQQQSDFLELVEPNVSILATEPGPKTGLCGSPARNVSESMDFD